MVVLGGASDEPEGPRVPIVGVAGAVAGEGLAFLSGRHLSLHKNSQDDQKICSVRKGMKMLGGEEKYHVGMTILASSSSERLMCARRRLAAASAIAVLLPMILGRLTGPRPVGLAVCCCTSSSSSSSSSSSLSASVVEGLRPKGKRMGAASSELGSSES